MIRDIAPTPHEGVNDVFPEGDTAPELPEEQFPATPDTVQTDLAKKAEASDSLERVLEDGADLEAEPESLVEESVTTSSPGILTLRAVSLAAEQYRQDLSDAGTPNGKTEGSEEPTPAEPGGDGNGEEPPVDNAPSMGGEDEPEESRDNEDQGVEAGNDEAAKPAGFADINEGGLHDTARHKINAKLETKAREELGIDLHRYPVADDKTDWATEYSGYNPTFVDLPHHDSSFNPETNQDDPSQIEHFSSLSTDEVQRDENGWPLNPMGRTGIAGRGILAKWGATEAADAIVTRDNPQTGSREVLVVQRRDTGEIALPGGKRDQGEEVEETASRELGEEAGVLGMDFSGAKVVYAGYIDDSRNTDNSWMESTALHRHLTAEEAEAITVQAGSDAADALWTEVNDGLYPRLFGSHGNILRLVEEDPSE